MCIRDSHHPVFLRRQAYSVCLPAHLWGTDLVVPDGLAGAAVYFRSRRGLDQRAGCPDDTDRVGDISSGLVAEENKGYRDPILT